MRQGLGSYFDDDDDAYGIDVTIKRRSAKAVQVHDGTKTVWVPKSLIQNLSDLPPDGRVANVRLPRWFIEKEALA